MAREEIEYYRRATAVNDYNIIYSAFEITTC